MQRIQAILLFVICAAAAAAQTNSPYFLDPRFQTIGVQYVKAVVDWNDGTGNATYIGGHFSSFGGVECSNIVKYDGVHFTPLGQGLTNPISPLAGSVIALAVHDDGTGPALFAAGNFQFAGGSPALNLAKWNGTSWSAVGSTVPNSINSAAAIFALVSWDDGTGPALYGGGSNFYTSTGLGNGVARWKNGAWSRLGNGVAGTVRALAVHIEANGTSRLYVGGNFGSAAGGATSQHLASWNGTNWVGGMGLGFTSVVNALTEYGGTTPPSLIVGGSFATSAALLPMPNLARWSNGSFTSIGANGEVVSLATVVENGQPAVYASGVFSTLGGVPAAAIGRWTPLGAQALGFGLIFGGGGTTVANASLGAAAPRLVVGGVLAVDTLGVDGIAAYDAQGWHGLNGLGLAGQVKAFAVDPSGPSIYAVGQFQSAGSLLAGGIARWNGQTWSRVGNGIGLVTTPGLGFAGAEDALHFDDGNGPALYISGGFTSVDNVPMPYLAKWNGGSWSGFPGLFSNGSGGSIVQRIAAYAPSGSPSLYAALTNIMLGNGTQPSLVRWTGSNWAVIPGISGTIKGFTVFDDGSGKRLFACGSSLTINGTPNVAVAAWNGATWQIVASSVTASVLPFVRAMAVHDDGTGPALYAAGNFTAINGVPAQYVARWNGTAWSDAGRALTVNTSPTVTIERLTSFPTDQGAALVAVGDFGFSAAQPSVNAMWLRAGNWSSLVGPPGPSGTVSAVAILPDAVAPSLCLGGSFTSTAGVPTGNIARLAPIVPEACASLAFGARGQVGAAAGGPYDVLTISGSSGGPARRIDLSIGQPFTIDMAQPPSSPLPAAFEIFGFIGVPQLTEGVMLPFGLGPAAFPFCPLQPIDARLFELTNNLAPSPCTAYAGSSPAPWSMSVPGGLPFAFDFALQGMIYDATSPSVLSTTNAVLCIVR